MLNEYWSYKVSGRVSYIRLKKFSSLIYQVNFLKEWIKLCIRSEVPEVVAIAKQSKFIEAITINL